jgi:Predicted aminoglycoside phosphotransferase
LMPRYANALRIINSYRDFQELSLNVPEFYCYNTSYKALATAFMKDYESVDDFFLRHLHVNNPVLDMMTDIVASVGPNITDSNLTQDLKESFPCSYPWILDTIVPESASFKYFMDRSAIVRTINTSPALQSIVDKSRRLWSPSHLIHGDIKWSNFLINTFQQQSLSIKLTDWETADYGDPIWDLAGIVQNIVCNKILINEQLLLQGYTDYNIASEINSILKSISSVIRRYIAHRNLDYNTEIDKALYFTSARLMQTAIEGNSNANHIKHNATKILKTTEYVYNNISVLVNFIKGDTREHY